MGWTDGQDGVDRYDKVNRWCGIGREKTGGSRKLQVGSRNEKERGCYCKYVINGYINES